MQMVTRHRWEEVRDVWPDDYKAPTMDTLKIDSSWADLRSQQNMNGHEKQWMREYKQLCARLGPYVPNDQGERRPGNAAPTMKGNP